MTDPGTGDDGAEPHDPTGSAHVASLYRFPVKGLCAQSLDTVALRVGEMIACDRIYAIENGPGRFDAMEPKHLAKTNFLMLMRNERLATLTTTFDDGANGEAAGGAGHVLTVFRDGRQVARGDLATPIGRQLIEQFFAAFMKAELRGAPRVVMAAGHNFSDTATKAIHVVNLASVRELERIAGKPIDPLRFRANVYIDGIPPWEEFNWLDRTISVGGATLRGYAKTDRCDATNVDPKTGDRDMAIPRLLERTFGHTDFGFYARVSGEGTVKAGDPVDVKS